MKNEKVRAFNDWWGDFNASDAGNLIDGFSLSERAKVAAICKLCFDAASAPSAPASLAHDWKKAVLDLSWIPLNYRHDVIRNLERLPQPEASEREPLPCGCVPAIISPTCSKGHVKGAFALKPQTRPSFAVDLEG